MAGPGRRIETTRLVLEPIPLATARAVLAGDLSGVRAGAGWPHEDTLDGLRTDAGADAHDDRTGWFITLKDGGLVIGDCGWRGGPGPDGEAEIGYGLAAPYRGRGYGGEAVAGLVGWARRQPGVRRLVAEVRAENTVSRRVLERQGFTVARVEQPWVHYELTV